MEFEDLKKTPSLTARDEMDEFYDEIMSYPPEKRRDKWTVSWSDLMMTMFIFFTIMYAFRVGNKELFFGDGPGKNTLSESGSQTVLNIGLESNPSTVYDQTKMAVSEVMVDGPDSLELIRDGSVRIVLAGDLLFDPGRVELKIGARYQLDQIARVLNENELAVNVVGHTDDSPTRSDLYPTNWDLSSKRAVMVARYLTEIAKLDEKRVFISAYSSHQPVATNDDGRNRALNRRVEIILMKTKPYEQ